MQTKIIIVEGPSNVGKTTCIKDWMSLDAATGVDAYHFTMNKPEHNDKEAKRLIDKFLLRIDNPELLIHYRRILDDIHKQIVTTTTTIDALICNVAMYANTPYKEHLVTDDLGIEIMREKASLMRIIHSLVRTTKPLPKEYNVRPNLHVYIDRSLLSTYVYFDWKNKPDELAAMLFNGFTTLHTASDVGVKLLLLNRKQPFTNEQYNDASDEYFDKQSKEKHEAYLKDYEHIYDLVLETTTVAKEKIA